MANEQVPAVLTIVRVVAGLAEAEAAVVITAAVTYNVYSVPESIPRILTNTSDFVLLNICFAFIKKILPTEICLDCFVTFE